MMGIPGSPAIRVGKRSMLPLVDMHVHLLAGLDDGPRTRDDAIAMARAMVAEGVGYAAALAHQNATWPDVTPDRICTAVKLFESDLREANIDLRVYPTAEVMVHPTLDEDWRAGKFMSVGGRGEFVLLEMPHQLFVDLRAMVGRLREFGVKPILAHPERTPELLHDPGRIESLIRMGCLVQVSAKSITEPANAQEARAVRDWVRRGIVHMLGSDGHSVTRRPPHIAEAVRTISRWCGPSAADRIGGTYGLAVLTGLPLHIPPPQAPSRRWWSALWG